MSSPYNKFEAIMVKHGACCSPEEFYWHVNAAFHNAEADNYDDIHIDMFEYSNLVWARLTSHLMKYDKKHRVLDIGSGTGNIGDMLEKYCPLNVKDITLLEPSKAMIQQCNKKRLNWSFPSQIVEGDISLIYNYGKFDLITINSVLHHIVELGDFCSVVQNLLNSDGIVLTAQDPRFEALSDTVLDERMMKAKMDLLKKLRFKGLYSRLVSKTDEIVCKLTGRAFFPKLAKKTNYQLKHNKVITTDLTMEEIYAITDFHVPGLARIGSGIGLDQLKIWFDKLELIDYFSFQYQGIEWTCMNKKQRQLETELWQTNDKHGSQFGSAWQVKHQQ